MKNKDKLGRGFIERACGAVGVKRGVYYNAKRNLKNENPLTADQISVMKKYHELKEEAESTLEVVKR